MADIPLNLGTLIEYVEGAEAAPLDRLAAAYGMAGRLNDQADHLIGHFVDQARRSGASWTEIGSRMGGVTKQAVQKRFTIDLGDYEEVEAKAFARYTAGARATITAARAAAREHHHAYIGTEHVLLGLLAVRDGPAAAVIEACGVSVAAVRDAALARLLAPSDSEPERIPFTVKAKKSIDLALRESLWLGDSHIGTEHQLLGLLAEGTGLAAQVLSDFDLTDEQVRTEVGKLGDRAHS